MSTIDVKDAAGATQTVAKVVDTGSAADSASLGVAFSTEGKAQLGALTETAPATDTASSGLNGRLQRIAQRITSFIALFPASLGSKADASSLAVTVATEDKALIGALTETAPATDTASSGLNGRLQRIAQRVTSVIALLPTALGANGGIKADIVGGTANLAAAATGGYTPGFLRSAASINATSVKGSAGTLGFLHVVNTTSTIYFLKFWDKASAPDPSADTALIKWSYPIPADTTGAGIAVPIPPQGIEFATGIAFALTAVDSDADETVAATGVTINYAYK